MVTLAGLQRYKAQTEEQVDRTAISHAIGKSGYYETAAEKETLLKEGHETCRRHSGLKRSKFNYFTYFQSNM